MQVISLGPLVFAADRFAAILGIAVFILVTTILASRLDPRLGRWSSWTLAAGIVGARIWHVIEHGATFAAEPLRVFFVWQGGFAWPGAIVGVVLASALLVRSVRMAGGAVASLAVAVFAWHLTVTLTGDRVATPMPALTLERSEGGQVALADFLGRPVVVNLWATWCPPCRREMPMMAKVAAETPDVDFLFINQSEGRPAVLRYLATQPFRLKNVLLDPGQQTARHYNMPGLPVTLFIGADGKLRTLHVGEISPEALVRGTRALASGG